MDKRERVARAMLNVVNASASSGDRLHDWDDTDDNREAFLLADALIELWDALSYLEGTTLLQSTVEHVHDALGFREAAIRAFGRLAGGAEAEGEREAFEQLLDEELADVPPDGVRRAAPAGRPPGQG